MGAEFVGRTDLWTFTHVWCEFNKGMDRVRFRYDGRMYTRKLMMQTPYKIGFIFRGDFYFIGINEYNKLLNQKGA